jgi:hypothetical protein
VLSKLGRVENMDKATRKAELEATLTAARDELRAIEDAEAARQAEKLVGNCYVYRNCYSCPESEADRWNLYLRVVGATEGGGVSVVEFEVDKYGEVRIHRSSRPYQVFTGGGYKPIGLSELTAAWAALLDGPMAAFDRDIRGAAEARRPARPAAGDRS